MPIVRLRDHIEDYRLKALSPEMHQMAGRGDKKALTEFANKSILSQVCLGCDDVLVDIGCGDGLLLRMASGRTSAAFGIIPTADEKTRLQAVMPAVNFLVGTAQKLPLQSESASKIVCNGVLLLLESECEVRAALSEITRIARPGANIWVGEIPCVDEFAEFRMYRGTSMVGLLRYLLLNHGIRSFLGMCRRSAKAVLGNERIVLNSAGLFYANPAKVIELAQSCGLRLNSYFKHKEIDQEGRVVDSKYRYDYLFTK
jgi:SAM-dependent methyltransferase